MSASLDTKVLRMQSPKLFLKYMLGIPLQPFHEEWLKFVEENKQTIILAPRGSGKSTVITIGYSMWRALLDRSLRILIVSNTQRQAEMFLRQIQSFFESNHNILNTFGDIRGKVWSVNELDLIGHKSQKETTFTALGFQGSLIGRHMDIIMLDDIIDSSNCSTKLQRDKAWEWYFSVLLPMLEPGGEIHIIGTRWHEADIYSQLMKIDTYKSKVYKALTEDGKSYWPSRFPVELLKEYQRQNSSMFALQYQNEVINSATDIFDSKYFKYYEQLPPGLTYYQGVDLAATKEGDYFVICTVGKNEETGEYYVVDVFRDRISLAQQIEKILWKADQYNPVKIGIESVGYQAALANEVQRQAPLPIVQIQNKIDKVTRAKRLSVLFENGLIYLPDRESILVDELKAFPRGEHDDCVDALEMAISLSQSRLNWKWEDVKKSIYVGKYITEV